MDTTMCIKSTYSPICCIHMKSAAHWMPINHPPRILFMIQMKLRLPWDLWLTHWLGLWRMLYHYFLLCSCSDVGEERGLFSDGWEEWYSTSCKKSNPSGSVVLLCFDISCTRSDTWAGQASEHPSSIILVSWYRFFQHFVAFWCWHPCSPLFTLNLLSCCAMWTQSMCIWCSFNLIYFRCA